MKGFCLAATCAAVLLTAAGASAQTATVGGSVSNARGGAIANADVTLRVLPPPGAPAMPANMPGMAPDRTTTTAANGTFTFDQVPPGQYVLLVDAPGFERSSQEVTVANQPQTLAVSRSNPSRCPGAAPVAGARGSATDPQALLDRIKTLEQRIADLESGTVLSEPETRVKRDRGLRRQERERARRARAGRREEGHLPARARLPPASGSARSSSRRSATRTPSGSQIGVSAASVTQFAHQTRGDPLDPDANDHFYQLASADLLFSAGIAQYTSFFADIVGSQRRAARRRDPRADADQQLHRAPRPAERGERARSVAPHRAVLAEARRSAPAASTWPTTSTATRWPTTRRSSSSATRS